MSKTRYTNAFVITMDPDAPCYENGYLEVENGRVTGVGPMQGALGGDAVVVDMKGRVIMPGFITAHGHFYGQFVRGMPLDKPIENWQHALSRMWWVVDRKLDEEQVYYSAVMGLIDGLKAGMTTYFDHHVSAANIPGSLDIIERAMREAGARGCLCYEVTDRYGAEGAKQGIEENVRYAKKAAGDEMFRGMMGMHAGYSIGDETLAACVQAAKELDCGIHIHMAEDKADVADSYKLYDVHVVDRFNAAGMFGPKTITAHGVHLKPAHWQVLKQAGVTVAHNCRSNMNNGVGCSPVVQMMDAGVRVALGGDGFTYNQFEELATAILWQRGYNMDTSLVSGEQIKQLAFYNETELCRRIFGQEIGVLKQGAAADFLVVDYDPPTPMDAGNYLSHLSSFSGRVRDVVVNGEEVVKDGRCTKLDEEALTARCRESSRRLWETL